MMSAVPSLLLRRIRVAKERFLPFLRPADDNEALLRRHLREGELYGLFCNKREPVSMAVVADVGASFAAGGREAGLAPELAGLRVCECTLLATAPAFRGRGCGTQLLMRLCGLYDGAYDAMIVGTGETPRMRRFYEGRCGFHPCFRRAGFFMHGYPQPLIEDGVQLRDMLVFCRFLRSRGGTGA